MEIKIIERINIIEIPMIYQDDVLWSKQNFMKPPPINDLSKRIIVEMKSNPKEFIFHPLTIESAWYLSIDDIKVGSRYDHGNNGKKGLSFPENAKDYFVSLDLAEKGKRDLVNYFIDLDGKSRFGIKTKRAGEINNHFFLY